MIYSLGTYIELSKYSTLPWEHVQISEFASIYRILYLYYISIYVIILYVYVYLCILYMNKCWSRIILAKRGNKTLIIYVAAMAQ